MEIRALASGSTGNCYYINDGVSSVLLECGIPFKRIQRGLEFNVSALSACLITHGHGDHCKAVRDMMKAGIDCYMSRGTVNELGINGHRLHIIEPNKIFKVGSWSILPFQVEHDTAEPLGYLLVSGMEKLLFVTDTAYIKYKDWHEYIKPIPLTHIMIEANYSLDIIREKAKTGKTNRALKSRVIRSHMSLETLVELLKSNELSNVHEIFLLHLSDRNSDEIKFKQEVQKLTGKVVHIA